MFRFDCPSCGKKLKTLESKAGLKVNCPRCGQRLLIPFPSAPQATDRNSSTLLNTRICDLGLKIEGSILQSAVSRLLRDLKAAGINHLVPHCYLTSEWVVCDGTICIGMPFYLARPDLALLYSRQTGQQVWDDPDGLDMLLRHEMGHVVNYAYELFERPSWQQRFGIWSGDDDWVGEPDPDSTDHVIHLGGHYAQKNPDEDFAETFAVWLTPDSDWRNEYAAWTGALDKLGYCDRLMSSVRCRPPTVTEVWLGWDVSTMTETVVEFLRAI
jgi:DNA-directed RNA polymerase subunit RPC12/RpoP